MISGTQCLRVALLWTVAAVTRTAARCDLAVSEAAGVVPCFQSPLQLICGASNATGSAQPLTLIKQCSATYMLRAKSAECIQKLIVLIRFIVMICEMYTHQILSHTVRQIVVAC